MARLISLAIAFLQSSLDHSPNIPSTGRTFVYVGSVQRYFPFEIREMDAFAAIPFANLAG